MRFSSQTLAFLWILTLSLLTAGPLTNPAAGLQTEKVQTEALVKDVIARLQPPAHSRNSGFAYHFSKVEAFPDGNLAKIIPEVSREKGLIVHLKVTERALKNLPAMIEKLVQLVQISNSANIPGFENSDDFLPSRRFSSPMEWAETVWNAQAGSKAAELKLTRFELDAARNAEQKLPSPPYFQNRIASITKRLKLVHKEAEVESQARKMRWDRTRPDFRVLEKQELKLNALLLKNDRKGVRHLVEAYLPWPLMEPSEQTIWRNWLEAIETPDPKRLKLQFRGLGDDLLQKTKDGKVITLSPVLSRSKGNFTHRLRSLSTLRDQIGAKPSNEQAALTSSLPDEGATISRMMTNHAYDAQGSPFLSLSTYDIAQQFDSGKTHMRYGAFLIDERRLMPNFSSVSAEFEVLTPLFVFPDEMLAYAEAPHRKPNASIEAMSELWDQVEARMTKLGVPPEEVMQHHMSLDEKRFRIDAALKFEAMAKPQIGHRCLGALKKAFFE
ncbi:MAG TPA: hypothetical protein DCS07_10105 [Bdellovibrionales bacterium]|nr:MAG: hypothetical protein A2Z97_01415 [Bdellovibrionales bacterium GWB1_52_6]OFZ04991.1 MAG: hypothetical protein A2X97_00125 [Bdellovibrionales bacterium GWA1_52_35]OFZ40301.1 MAG: hypothetical protein A2070_10940 [Bdellovibrionales bacterium GWC1_52_8]HAR42964.1 hypothetical protein [Bdellovibrionales bacterium]HCM41221.1 hypothetical protein [Bdellovibrionales bacterium]